MGTDSATAVGGIATGERADLLETLRKHRGFLRFTVRNLTDEQAARRTTASALCLGGLIKHVTVCERSWIDFVLEGPDVMGKDADDWPSLFEMTGDDTLAGLLDAYDEVARRTDEVLMSLPDLDMSHPLPAAPWFPPGARWSARRVVLHLIAEIAQHAGHADIIRESLDGQKTMG